MRWILRFRKSCFGWPTLPFCLFQCRTPWLGFCWLGLAIGPSKIATSLLSSLVGFVRFCPLQTLFVFHSNLGTDPTLSSQNPHHHYASDTDVKVIEQTFLDLTQRKDIGILLINQHVANEIRSTLRDYTKLIPTVLEIPSKDIQYDAEKDYIMQRVNMVLGGSGGDN